jgi:transcriptional regulator of acetoin/glycerol metabolism
MLQDYPPFVHAKTYSLTQIIGLRKTATQIYPSWKRCHNLGQTSSTGDTDYEAKTTLRFSV